MYKFEDEMFERPLQIDYISLKTSKIDPLMEFPNLTLHLYLNDPALSPREHGKIFIFSFNIPI